MPQTPLVAFSCRYVHTAAKALHRLCASSPGSAWAFQSLSVLGSECGFRWTLQEPHSPQIFRSSLAAFPVRSSLIPIGGALCRFYALCGGVGRIVTAWQRHGDPAALDGSLFRRQQGKREPTGICDCSAARSQIPYYNRVALGFPEIDPVGLCSSECRCAAT